MYRHFLIASALALGVARADLTWDKPVQEFVVNGDWAFERYSYKSTDTPLAGGAVVEDTGWGLVIYRHDADGKWRVARDAWGPDHPVPAKWRPDTRVEPTVARC